MPVIATRLISRTTARAKSKSKTQEQKATAKSNSNNLLFFPRKKSSKRNLCEIPACRIKEYAVGQETRATNAESHNPNHAFGMINASFVAGPVRSILRDFAADALLFMVLMQEFLIKDTETSSESVCTFVD